jgi:Carboxypeptidase regulatory-like domain
MHLVGFIVFALAQIAQPAAQTGTLRGVVVDSRSKPLAGVDVWLSSGLPPTGERPMIGGVMWMQSGRAVLSESHHALGHTRTDNDGQFRIEIPGLIVRSQEPLPLALWAYTAGQRVASRRLPWAIPEPAEPVRLVIEKPTTAGFRLLGPDGAPAAGARVVGSAVDRMVVPHELAEKAASVAGPDGVVVLPAFAPGEIRWARVDSPRFGTQSLRTLGPETTVDSVFRLEPAGRVSGRVVTEVDKPVSGLPVRAQTFPEGYDLGGTLGSATVTTDADGRFEIPAIAAGRLAVVLDLRSRPDLPYRGLPPANQVVESGQTTTLHIRLKRAVRMEGVIRERAIGAPIAGVSPEIPDLAYRLGGNSGPVTDANGRFEGYIEGQQPYAFLYTAPKPFYIPESPDSFHLLPAGATEFTLPPLELARGVALRGSVVDETGRYVAGALVRASWGGDKNVLQSVAVRADSNGSFLLEGLDPLADLRLTAESDGRSSGPAQMERAGPEKVVKLVVSRANSILLAGRVLDSAGEPVVGAEVRLRSQSRGPQGQVWRFDPVAVFGERGVVRTDKDGRFQGPSAVPAGVEYEATITARNAPPVRTGWLKTTGGPKAEFADVVLHRIRVVEGVVHDRDGRAIGGATVFQSGDGPIRTRTVTDPEGRFRLPGVIAGKAILFARKDGFRFHGQPIATEAGAIDLVLTRVEERPVALNTLASAVSHAEELALARRLLAPYIEKVMAKGTDVQKIQALMVQAQVDPAHMLELLDTQSAGKPQFAVDGLRRMVATAMAGQSPDEAVSIAESIKEAGARAWCLTDLVDKLPESARDRKAGLLAQAQLQARSVKQPAERILLISRVAERWLDAGESERARVMLEEGRSLAKEVPPPAYPVALFAPSLSRIDLAGALALVESTNGLAKRGDRVNRVFVFDRAYGEIAYRVASSDPAGAERVLGMIVDAHRRGGYVVAACFRMALNDLPRARRLAETIEAPGIRAYALGQMARALAAVDRSSAIGLLEDAFNRLDEYRDDPGGYSSPDCVAAVLLPVVEAVAPARLQESVWRAVALRAPLLDGRGEGSGGRSDAELAMQIARYDRAAAAAVLARAIGVYRKTDVDSARQGFVAMALALIEPARLVSLVESLPDETGLDRTLAKNAARLFAAEILAKQGDERWKAARQWGVSIWQPEGSDF